MNAGHFNNSHESSGDLNRGRRTESRVLFGYFLHDAKSDNPYSLCREIRGFANLESAHKTKNSHNPIKSFRRPQRHLFGGLRRTKTCHRQLFARPSVLFGYFLHDAKSDNPFPFREARGSANLESAYPNNSFPLTKLNPFPKGDSRFCKPRISAPKTTISH